MKEKELNERINYSILLLEDAIKYNRLDKTQIELVIDLLKNGFKSKQELFNFIKKISKD